RDVLRARLVQVVLFLGHCHGHSSPCCTQLQTVTDVTSVHALPDALCGDPYTRHPASATRAAEQINPAPHLPVRGAFGVLVRGQPVQAPVLELPAADDDDAMAVGHLTSPLSTKICWRTRSNSGSIRSQHCSQAYARLIAYICCGFWISSPGLTVKL